MTFDEVKIEVNNLLNKMMEQDSKVLMVVGLCSPEQIDTVVGGYGSDKDIFDTVVSLMARFDEETGTQTFLSGGGGGGGGAVDGENGGYLN